MTIYFMLLIVSQLVILISSVCFGTTFETENICTKQPESVNVNVETKCESDYENDVKGSSNAEPERNIYSSKFNYW